MTITIDVCWIDHIGEWWNRHCENIGLTLLFIVLAGAIPVDIYLLGAATGHFEYETGTSGLLLLTGSALYGMFGTIFFIILLRSLLREANEKYKWFKIKHCEAN